MSLSDDLAERVLADQPRLGTTRVVFIDGPAGSGKTTLAAALAQRLKAPVIHMDDMYAGWEQDLDLIGETLWRDVLGPVSSGIPGAYARFDWAQGRFVERVTVPLTDVLIVEGCGSAGGPVDDVASLIVWVEAPDDLRLERGLARDGDAARAQWILWMRKERDHFASARTRERADVVVDGTAS